MVAHVVAEVAEELRLGPLLPDLGEDSAVVVEDVGVEQGLSRGTGRERDLVVLVVGRDRRRDAGRMDGQVEPALGQGTVDGVARSDLGDVKSPTA